MKRISDTGFSLLIVYIWIFLLLPACKTTQTSSKPATPKPVVSVPPPEAQPAVAEIKEVKKQEVVNRNFAMIMPFELEQNFEEVTDETAEPMVSQSSLAALNFYEGALMAIDSLKSKKIDLKLMAYDTPGDSAAVVRLMTNTVFKEADVVIGTFPNNLSHVAANVAKKHKINLLLTQSGSPELLQDNEQVALALASTKTQCREMVTFMMDQFADANIILIFRTVNREDELAKVFRQEISKRSVPADFHDFNASKNESTEIAGLLSKIKRNLVFVISSDEAFVSPLLSLMEEKNIFGIKVSGLPTWINFESIDFMAFKNLQTYLFDNNFIDLDIPGTGSFRKSFISRFHIDPLPAAYNGFDMVFQMGVAVTEPRPAMQQLIKSSFSGGSKTFDFVNTVPGGLENKAISVLQIADYKLVRLNK